MLVAQGIHKIFGQSASGLHVLKGIDLTINDGEVLSIVGPSGAGKSTLLHIMGGLDSPTQGAVLLDGESIYQLSDSARAKLRNQRIGFVFQFYHLLPELTALENIFLPALIKGGIRTFKELEEQGKSLISRIGLKERAQHLPNQLSGGEQQRIAIARALINQPRIIFCDEPTGNLDSESGRQVIQLLLGLNKTNNQTLVIVTHDEEIAKLSDRIIKIKDGVLVK